MSTRQRCRFQVALALGLMLALSSTLGGCAGDASDGESPTIEFDSTSECIRFDGGFPSDLVLLPGTGGEAATVQLVETAVLGLDLDHEPPRLLARDEIPSFPQAPACSRCGALPVDSDSDGVADACHSNDLGFGCLSPIPGDLFPLTATRIALSTTDYDQILFVDPTTNLLLPVELDPIEASATFEPDDWPFWPAAGERPIRSGISTRYCVYGQGFVGSLGAPIGAGTSCDQIRDGFSTRFTAGVTSVRGRLFVATSNFLNYRRGLPSQYAPGTLLVFDYDETTFPPRARPDPERAVILLSGFNPTGVTTYTTPSGRNLILVNVTGALAIGTGTDLVRSESAVDVIDAESLDVIATIPLGRAGLGFSELTIDPTRRVALVGAATSRALFGIDLAALDDPMLGHGPDPLPIVLDGSNPFFADARVFSASSPFLLPARADGPPASVCTTQTSVALSDDGPWGVTSDACDGTVAVLALSLPASRQTPLDPATVVRVDRVNNVAAPWVPELSDRLHAIDRVLIRPGAPGIDFDGPDVYFTAGLPEGAVCGTHINALD